MPGPFEVIPADPLGTIQDFRQTIAKTSQMETKAAADKAGLAQDQQFQSMLKQVSPSLPMMEKLSAIATAAAGAGKFREAETTLAAMSQLENRESLAEQRSARAQELTTKAAGQKMDRQLELISGVKSPLTWRLALDAYKSEFGEDKAYKELSKYPYSPEIVRWANDALTKKKGATDEALNKARAVAEYAKAARDKLVGEAQARNYNARTDATKNKTDAGVKAGGKLAEVKPAELKEVEAKIKLDYPRLTTEERDLATREIASDAKDIQLREHGSFTDAMARALEARKGQFAKFPASTFLGIETSKPRSTYTSLPAGVPKGSKAAQWKSGGKEYSGWKAPDGKYYVDDPEEE